jgi:hypothetical protein
MGRWQRAASVVAFGDHLAGPSADADMLGDPGYGEIGVAEGWPCVPENKVQRPGAPPPLSRSRRADGITHSIRPDKLL